ncbi:UNVERIFIED_ORG: hypothetical protein BDU10_3100 [Burkholderia sp. CF145]
MADDNKENIERLTALVNAARHEMELALMFRETWRPAAYDTGLHTRMGESFASHSFQIIRLSLWRESLLALVRMWDTNKQAVRMSLIRDRLNDNLFFDALILHRASETKVTSAWVAEAMRSALEPQREAALSLLNKYSERGDGYVLLERLRALRHERLAHRQVFSKNPIAPSSDNLPVAQPAHSTEADIEVFYQDNLELVGVLLGLFMATTFDMKGEATAVYRQYAEYFWAAARGERTEGHPGYRPPPSLQPGFAGDN